MQNDPMPPRPRMRRTDRNAAQEGQVQRPVSPQQLQPIQQPVDPQRMPVQQPVYPQRMQPMQQPVDPQQRSTAASPTPRALQNQRQQVQSGWQMPTGSRPDTVQRYSPEPRPTARSRKPIRPLTEEETPAKKKPARPAKDTAPSPKTKPARLPGWLVTVLTMMLILVMGLTAAKYLTEAYIVTQEKERQAAYEAVLANYHVTIAPEGYRTVTWHETIERYAAQNNLQPAFVAAIIRNESSFRTNAESGVGARGLMQLMPDTAEWIAGKLNDANYTFDSMWDAETNIRYGCWYLGYLSELFRGDPVLVCAAYHAGQGDVRRWLGDRSISPDGLTIPLENVPIAETRQYAGRVTQAYGIYQTLLYTDDPQLPVYDAGSAAPASVNAR